MRRSFIFGSVLVFSFFKLSTENQVPKKNNPEIGEVINQNRANLVLNRTISKKNIWKIVPVMKNNIGTGLKIWSSVQIQLNKASEKA